MKPTVLQTLRSRWLAACVHAALWLLLCLVIFHLGGSAPAFRENDGFSPPPQSPVPVAKLDALFSPGIWPRHLADANTPDPFFTRYFLPKPAAPPPVPTTRKIEVTYLGYYQTASGPRQAVVKLAEGILVFPPGGRLATNLFVAQASFQTLLLTNSTAQTNMLTVNAKKEIEVPLR
jgi:hypothetical protein